MIGLSSTFIVVQALTICVLLYLFARHEADYSFSSVVLVTIGIILGNFFIGLGFFKYIGPFAIIPIFFFTTFMLVKFSWVSWPKGMLITLLYFVITAAIAVGKLYFQTGHFAWDAAGRAEQDGPQNKYDASVKEGMEVFNSLNESTARMQASARGEKPPAQGTNTAGTANTRATPPPAPAAAVNPPLAAGQNAAQPQADWSMAKSQLRIRGWMNDRNGNRTATVNDQIIPLGGTAYADYNGLRYTWRLTSLDGYKPTWTPVDAVPILKQP